MSPTEAILSNVRNLDLSSRFLTSTVIVASPALAAETIICTLTVPADITLVAGVRLEGYATFTVGTSGTNANLRIRQTNAVGASIVPSGAVPVTAATAAAISVTGFDSAPAAGLVYVLTLQVTAGAAASTVSACCLVAVAI